MSRDVLYLDAQGEHWLMGGAVHAHAPVAVVADFVEEALVRATLPQVRGRDLDALVTRRLQQEFRETAFRTAFRIGPGRAPRTLDYALLGLPVAPALNPVLAKLADAGRGVSGVWTVTLLVDAWMREARAKPAALLVVLPTPAGIRHVFLENGRPVLSRLVPGSDAAGARAELERTVLYLYNARLLERGTTLPAWAWGPGALVDAPGLGPVPTPRVRGLPDPAERGLDALLELALRKPPAIQLAPDAARLHYIAWRMRRHLAVGAGLAAIALVGVAGLRWSAARGLDADARALTAQAAAVQADIDRVQVRYAQVGADAQTVREALDAQRTLVDAVPAFDRGLAVASLGFDAAPAYRLESLHWRLADPAAVAPPDGEACPGATADGTDPAAAPAAGIALSGTLSAALLLRAAVQSRERFEAAFRGTTGVSLQSRRVPVDASGGVIRGGGTGEDERSFAYCLQWSPAP